jgi:hypothetical protein
MFPCTFFFLKVLFRAQSGVVPDLFRETHFTVTGKWFPVHKVLNYLGEQGQVFLETLWWEMIKIPSEVPDMSNFSYTHLSQLSESAHLIGKCSIILSLNSFRYPQVRCLTVCGCLSNLTIMDLEVTSLVEQIEDQGNWYILTGFHFVTEKAPFEVARSFHLC